MGVGTIISIIFVTLYLILYIKFNPSIDKVEGKYILWYTIKGKVGNSQRDYIELF